MLCRPKRTLPGLVLLAAASCLACWLAGSASVVAFPQEEEPKTTRSVLVPTPGEADKHPTESDPAVEQASGTEPVGDPAEIAAAGNPRAVRFQPTRFAELVPGLSTSDEVREVLGEPRLSLQQGERQIQTFMLEPYERVGIVMHGDRLESIRLHVAGSLTLDEFLKELNFPASEGVRVRLAQAGASQETFPERGVDVICREEGEKRVVSQVSFHPIREFDFLLAAEQMESHHFTRALQLARDAQQLAPESTAGAALEARILFRCGEYQKALEKLNQLVPNSPADVPSQLLQAQLWSETRQDQNAIDQVRQIRNSPTTMPLWRARAALLLGQLVDRQAERAVVIQYHEEAIERTRQLLAELAGAERTEAILLLVDAHRSMARVVAEGDWEEEATATAAARWLEVAGKLALQLAQRGAAPELVQLDGIIAQMGIHAVLRDEIDEGPFQQQLESTARTMMDSETDPLLVRELHWKLGRGLYLAAQLARQRGDTETSIGLALKADKQLNQANSARLGSRTRDVLLGSLHFLIGSQYAIAKEDHLEAVKWYKKALTPLGQPGIETRWTELGWHGERFVSMGISFWQAGDQTRGLDLTKQGSLFVERAVDQDGFPSRHLAVPYGNLSYMYRSLGKEQEAEKFARLAASVEAPDPERR